MKTLWICAVVLAAANVSFGASTLLDNPNAEDLTLTGGASTVGKVEFVTDAGGALTGILNFYDVVDANWQTVGHQLDLHDASGAFVRTVASDSIASGYASYLTVNDGTVYAGRTGGSVTDTADHRIDAVSLTSAGATFDAGTQVATLVYGYDIQFNSLGEAYALANAGGFNPETDLVRVDLSGANNHQVVADVGGYTAELVFDAADNLYSGTNGLAQNTLYRYTAAQIATGGLTLGDAEVLSDLPLSADGMAIDEEGNLFVSMNDYSSWPASGMLAAVWNDKDYSSYGSEKFDVLSTSTGSVGNLSAIGDVSIYEVDPAHAVYGVGYGGPVAYVPEPATLTLIALGGLAALRRRRRA